MNKKLKIYSSPAGTKQETIVQNSTVIGKDTARIIDKLLDRKIDGPDSGSITYPALKEFLKTL